MRERGNEKHLFQLVYFTVSQEDTELKKRIKNVLKNYHSVTFMILIIIHNITILGGWEWSENKKDRKKITHHKGVK